MLTRSARQNGDLRKWIKAVLISLDRFCNPSNGSRVPEGTAEKVDSDLDSAIDKNLDAILVQHRLKDDVRYDVNNGVVTLKGNVEFQTQRTSVEKLAKEVHNVKDVVNKLDIKHQKATASR